MRPHQQKNAEIMRRVRGGLIVSCQALPREPLHGPGIMARMARAAIDADARGIRANTPPDIDAIRRITEHPIIGLFKDGDADVFITPSRAHAFAIIDAGCDMVALDATGRPRPSGESLADLIGAIQARDIPVMADISTFEEGINAAALGADVLSTTLSGYTPYSRPDPGPDLELVARLAREAPCPVIAEGRIATPEQAARALEAGAHAVVVGSAITRPQWIAREFVNAIDARDDA